MGREVCTTAAAETAVMAAAVTSLVDILRACEPRSAFCQLSLGHASAYILALAETLPMVQSSLCCQDGQAIDEISQTFRLLAGKNKSSTKQSRDSPIRSPPNF